LLKYEMSNKVSQQEKKGENCEGEQRAKTNGLRLQITLIWHMKHLALWLA